MSKPLPQRSDSRWLAQTKRGGLEVSPEERGDCVPACLASILGKPLDAFAVTHGPKWWDRLQDQLEPHGYCLAQIDLTLEPPPAYWIAAVPSLNLPPDKDGRIQTHCIVCHGYDFTHDPALADRYDQERWVRLWNDGEVREGWALVQREPLRPTREERALRRILSHPSYIAPEWVRKIAYRALGVKCTSDGRLAR